MDSQSSSSSSLINPVSVYRATATDYQATAYQATAYQATAYQATAYQATATRRALALLATVALVAILALTGCGRQAVRASEKEFLADRIMVFDEDGQETTADEHILTNREGSAGGRGSGGGGCGCN